MYVISKKKKVPNNRHTLYITQNSIPPETIILPIPNFNKRHFSFIFLHFLPFYCTFRRSPAMAQFLQESAQIGNESRASL